MMESFEDFYQRITHLDENEANSLDLSFLTDEYLKNLIFNSEYSNELCSKIISLPNYIAEYVNDIPKELIPKNYLNRLVKIVCDIQVIEDNNTINTFHQQLLVRLLRNGLSKEVVNSILSPTIISKNNVSNLFSFIHKISLSLDEFHLKKFVKHILDSISPLYKLESNKFHTHKSITNILEQFKSFNLITMFHPLSNLPLIPSVHLLDIIENKHELWEYLIHLWSDERLNSMLPPSSQILIGSYLTRLLIVHLKSFTENDFVFISSGIHWRLSSYEKSARLSGVAMVIAIKKLNSAKLNSEDDDITFDEFECPESNLLKASMEEFIESDSAELHACSNKTDLVQQACNTIEKINIIPYQRSHLTKPFYLRQILERIQGNLVRGEVDFELVKNLSGGSPLDKVESPDQKMQRIIQALVYLQVVLDKNPPDSEIETLSVPVAKSLLSLITTYDISQRVECMELNEVVFNNSITENPKEDISLGELISMGLTKLILVSFKPLITLLSDEAFGSQLSIQSKLLFLESAINGIKPNRNGTFKAIHPSLAAFGVVEILNSIENFINRERPYSNVTHLNIDGENRLFDIDSTEIILISRLIDLIVCLKISSGSGWNLIGSESERINIRLDKLKVILLNHLPPNYRLMESLSLVENYL